MYALPLQIPVVFTGSQLPLVAHGTDARTIGTPVLACVNVDELVDEILRDPVQAPGATGTLAFDPGAGKAFSSNGEGTMTVAGKGPSGRLEVLETVTTEPRARTLALDTATHRLFLVTAQFGTAPAPTAEHPRPRAAKIPTPLPKAL